MEVSSISLQMYFQTCSQVFFKMLSFSNIHRKTPVLVPLFNKVAGLKACNFIKKRLQHGCFPLNIATFLKISFFYRTPLVAADGCSASVLKRFIKLTGKHLSQNLQGCSAANFDLLENILHYRYFPVNFAKYLRTISYTSPNDCF